MFLRKDLTHKCCSYCNFFKISKDLPAENLQGFVFNVTYYEDGIRNL